MSTKQETAIQKIEPMSVNIYNSDNEFQRAGNIARTLAASTLVPEIYRNSPANCMIALEMSARLKMPPFMVMQQMHIIHQKPSFSAAFIIGRINISGQFSRLKFKFEGEGNDRRCHAFATDKEDGELVEGPEATIKMAIAEGWYGKNGSKWPNMPDLMLTYRAAAFFARVNCPDILLGMQTTEELNDFMVGPDVSDDALTDINGAIKNKQEASTPASEGAQKAAPSEPQGATDLPFEDIPHDNAPKETGQAPVATEPKPMEMLVPADKLGNAKAAYQYYLKLHKELTGFDGSLSPEAFIDNIRVKAFKATSICEKMPEYNLGDMPPQEGQEQVNDSLT